MDEVNMKRLLDMHTICAHSLLANKYLSFKFRNIPMDVAIEYAYKHICSTCDYMRDSKVYSSPCANTMGSAHIYRCNRFLQSARAHLKRHKVEPSHRTIITAQVMISMACNRLREFVEIEFPDHLADLGFRDEKVIHDAEQV